MSGLDRRRLSEGLQMSDDELIAAARDVQKRAHAPYSGFPVGAALLSRDGRVFTGANVENASIGLSACAERNAVAKAISEGARDFEKLAVVTDASDPVMPCGVCRQVLWEFSHDLVIVVESREGRRATTTIGELLPYAFTSFERSDR